MVVLEIADRSFTVTRRGLFRERSETWPRDQISRGDPERIVIRGKGGPSTHDRLRLAVDSRHKPLRLLRQWSYGELDALAAGIRTELGR